MITNLSNSCANTSFGMIFPTRRVIASEIAPYAFFSNNSSFFNNRINIVTVDPNSPNAANKVKTKFRKQYPGLSKALQDKYEELRNTDPEKHEKINTDNEALAAEIDEVMKEYNLKSTIDIEV